LIGRSLRAAIDLEVLGENSITLDCDVIQADGGTRTASITGACVAMVDAVNYMLKEGIIKKNPIKQMIAAISVGIYEEHAVLDLDYPEDSNAETDLNVIMAEDGGFVEIQGTAEGAPFRPEELTAMLDLAKKGIAEIIEIQRQALDS